MHITTIVGRVGSDPKPIGSNGCGFSIATEEYNSSTGERDTTWSRMVAFGKTAEFCQKWVTKGKMVAVSCRYQVREYEANGEKRTDHGFFILSIDPFIERDPNRQKAVTASSDNSGGSGSTW